MSAVACEGRQAGVLIFPPDMSVALLADNEEIAVLDSHEHGRNGGIITVCRSKNIEDFFLLSSDKRIIRWLQLFTTSTGQLVFFERTEKTLISTVFPCLYCIYVYE